MHLCGESVSPYFERVVIALDIKGAADQLKVGGMPAEFKSEVHFRYHPMGKIPFLILEDGTSLTEGQIIAEYLDAVLDGPKLIPHDPHAAALTRLLCRILDQYYAEAVSPMGRVSFGGTATDEELDRARNETLPAALNYLEKFVSAGPRAVGEDWTLADTAFLSHFYWYDKMLPRFGVEGFGDRPKLTAYWKGIRETDVGKRCFARMNASVEKFFGAKKG